MHGFHLEAKIQELYDISTGEFTELGKLYSSVGIPAGYQDDSVDVIKENDIKDILIK